MSNRQRWQWERGNDTEGWVKIPFRTVGKPTYEYTPTAADAGYSLRASVEYTDNDGNQVRVVTEPSSPVAWDTAPPPERPRTSSFFFLDIFPIDGVSFPPFARNGEDFSRFEFIPDREFDVLLDERCMAVRFPLPPFDIARIRTGESTDEGRLWEAEVSFDE